MAKDVGCHSFGALMLKSRQQNDNQHLLHPLNQCHEQTHWHLESKPEMWQRK
jgi:hypothetical protein